MLNFLKKRQQTDVWNKSVFDEMSVWSKSIFDDSFTIIKKSDIENSNVWDALCILANVDNKGDYIFINDKKSTSM